jgi:hypothetical protein
MKLKGHFLARMNSQHGIACLRILYHQITFQIIILEQKSIQIYYNFWNKTKNKYQSTKYKINNTAIVG